MEFLSAQWELWLTDHSDSSRSLNTTEHGDLAGSQKPSQTFAAEILQIVASIILIILTITQCACLKPLSRTQARWAVSRLIYLAFQVGISVLLVLDLTLIHQDVERFDDPLDLVPLGVHAASFAAAFSNIGAILLGQPPSDRALYHLVSSLTWAWLNSSGWSSVPIDSPVNIDSALPVVYASAFLLDLLTGSISTADYFITLTWADLLEWATCSWLNPILLSKEALEPALLPDIGLPDQFQAYQAVFVAICAKKGQPFLDLVRFLASQHGVSLIASVFLRLVDDVSKVALPFQLRSILGSPLWNKILLLLFTRIVGSLCGTMSLLRLRGIGVYFKAMLSASIHQKTMRLGIHRVPKGSEVSTLSEVDSQNLFGIVVTLHDFWSYPLQCLLALGGLLYLLPWEGVLAVLALAGLMFPILNAITSRMGTFIGRNMSLKDARTKLTTETLRCIRSIKLHAWESSFEERLNVTRASEISAVKDIALINALLVSFIQLIPSALTLAAFTVSLLKNVKFDNQLVFSSIMLFTLLNQNLQMLSGVFMYYQGALTYMVRIRDYINQPEASTTTNNSSSTEASGDIPAVELDHVGLAWPGDAAVVSDACMVVKQGEMAVISGVTGCGKSSILLSLLGYLKATQGSVRLRGRVAYFSQDAFLISSTVKENILFGRDFNGALYNSVVSACALAHDFDAFPLGDQTLLDGSVALSGGQKARICLARAVYSQAEVYVLDDPLSAVDVKLQRFIVRRVFGRRGLLANTIRVVASNTGSLLAEADLVYEISNNCLTRSGNASLVDFGEGTSSEESFSESGRPEASKARMVVSVAEDIPAVESTDDEAALSPTELEAENNLDDEETPLVSGATGAAPRHPMWKYFSYAKPFGWPIGLGSLILGRVVSVSANLALKQMISETTTAGLIRDLSFFAGCTLVQSTLFFIFIYSIFRLCILPAGIVIHRQMVHAVLSRPLSFFETMSTGEILNRFTNDLSRVDGTLNFSLMSLTAQFANLSFTFAVLVFASPTSLSFIIPLGLTCWYVQGMYLTKLRELRQLELATRAPVLTCVQEADKGAVLFNVFGFVEARLNAFATLLQENLRALFPMSCIDIWLNVRLEILGVTLQALAFAALLFLKVELSLVGFVMTYVFQITGNLTVITRFVASFEGDLVSLKRVQEYIAMGDERQETGPPSPVLEAVDTASVTASTTSTEGVPVPASCIGALSAWPTAGLIEFSSFSARYRSDLPLSLRDVSLTVQPGEKVAVVGRTGAGKTSLVLALLGLLRAAEGRVTIDEVDLATLDSVQLRRKLALIPQDTVVFPGTVRENVDPLGVAEDEDIRSALEKATVSAALGRLLSRGEGDGEGEREEEGSLLDAVLETGSDLSGGEVQLLALARALLQESKVLILDEATSGLDQETEQTIHKVLRRNFADTTTVAVMHRLELTPEYDKVLVLANGEVLEYDTPAVLVNKEGGHYASMLETAGLLVKARAQLGELIEI